MRHVDIPASDHERIASEYNDANTAMLLAFGTEHPMQTDIKRIQNRYWKFAPTGTDDANRKARALRDKLHQIANAINHDLRQFGEE